MHARFLARSLTPDNPCAYRCRHHTRISHAFLTHPMPRNMQGRSSRSVARTQRYEQEPSAPAAALARDGSATARVRERRANSGTDVQHAIAANHTRPIMLPLYAGPAHHAYQAHRAQKLRIGRTFHHEDPETLGRRPRPQQQLHQKPVQGTSKKVMNLTSHRSIHHLRRSENSSKHRYCKVWGDAGRLRSNGHIERSADLLSFSSSS